MARTRRRDSARPVSLRDRLDALVAVGDDDPRSPLHRKLVEARLDDMLKAQRQAVDRIIHRYRQLGTVLLDVVGQVVPVQVELASDEIHDGRRNELARRQQSARVAEHAQLRATVTREWNLGSTRSSRVTAPPSRWWAGTSWRLPPFSWSRADRWPAAPFAFESSRMVPSTTLLLVAGRRQRELRMKDVIALLNDQRSELLDSVARIDAAIAALGVTPRSSAPSREPAKRRRREMSAEAKQAASDRMKNYWAERRKQAETPGSGDAENTDDAPTEA